MIARLLPDGRIPTTRPPTISFTTHEGRPRLELSSETEGASLGYRLGDDRLRLYTGPVEVEAGQSVEACAVRYGFEESETASARAPR